MSSPGGNSINRRSVLKLGGAAAVTAAIGVPVGVELAERPPVSDYSGIPDELQRGERERQFSRFVTENYDVDSFNPSGHDAIVDARYVEGEEFTEEHARGVEQIFSEAGIDLKFLEYQERYPRERFRSRYDPSTDDILGRDDSLYTDWTEDVMKEAAIQVFFTPGKQAEWGEKIVNGEEHNYEDLEDLERGTELGTNAVAYGDRAAVVLDEYASQPVSEREGNPEMKMYKTAHEIGHTLGLGHTDEKDNLMYGGDLRPGRRPGFDQEQVERMLEQLE